MLNHMHNQFYCLEGDPGPLPTSEIELFVIIVHSWKLLYNNYCLKESYLRCGKVPKSAFEILFIR